MTTALAEIQTALRSRPGGQHVRWTKPDQIHLTLRFLGDIASDEAATAVQQLQFACRGFESFSLEVGGLGCFPNLQRPRVVWLGLQGAVPTLIALQNSITQALATLGEIREQKNFHPHLTLGRLRPGIRPPDLGLIRDVAPQRLGRWQVHSVLLMRSELRPEGAAHSLLFSHPLGHTRPP